MLKLHFSEFGAAPKISLNTEHKHKCRHKRVHSFSSLIIRLHNYDQSVRQNSAERTPIEETIFFLKNTIKNQQHDKRRCPSTLQPPTALPASASTAVAGTSSVCCRRTSRPTRPVLARRTSPSATPSCCATCTGHQKAEAEVEEEEEEEELVAAAAVQEEEVVHLSR